MLEASKEEAIGWNTLIGGTELLRSSMEHEISSSGGSQPSELWRSNQLGIDEQRLREDDGIHGLRWWIQNGIDDG